jgi:hypothetical protein
MTKMPEFRDDVTRRDEEAKECPQLRHSIPALGLFVQIGAAAEGHSIAMILRMGGTIAGGAAAA